MSLYGVCLDTWLCVVKLRSGKKLLAGDLLANESRKHSVIMKQERKSLYELATARIVEQLEEGGVPPWRRTWGSYGLARNLQSDKPYKGVNAFFLNLIAPYRIPYYLTYRQVQEMGGKVKRGSKVEYVYYYRTYYKDENRKTIPLNRLEQYDLKELEQIRFLKSFKVFNIESCEGIEWTPPPPVNRDNDPIEEAEAILRTMKEPPRIVSVSTEEAYYAPQSDVINMPGIRQFESSAMYYRTLLHECVHWTGHETRLARPGITERIERGSERYAEEELIAELGSHYLCAVIGIDDEVMREVSVGYLDAWIRRLKEDPGIIFRVAPRAQDAAEFVLGKALEDRLR